MLARALPILAILALAACAGPQASTSLSQPAVAADPGELRLVRGYRSAPDPCRIAGETPFTQAYLDDARDLVACPVGSLAGQTLEEDQGGEPVAASAGYVLYSVPRR